MNSLIRVFEQRVPVYTGIQYVNGNLNDVEKFIESNGKSGYVRIDLIKENESSFQLKVIYGHNAHLTDLNESDWVIFRVHDGSILVMTNQYVSDYLQIRS